ncbi:MAG TPA: TonB family protein, partial [Vicinamibacteria bacterium]|nr:TonB family protein [Vicinamibacteria bacterium]
MLPERFGRYEVIDELGDGAMGRVYRAWDPAVNRVVAVKTIKSEYLTRDTADEYLKRFRREAQSAGGLNHPAIVRVFDLGDDFLVMELVEGRTLHRLIREEGRLAPEMALRLLAPVADAVDHAHRAGIVHRDIKPANVMVDPGGQPKLMDFGVAKIEASVMTTAGQILGSPSYMSPEQIAGENVTSRSDLYSLAVVAYEMLTGQPPFQGKTITQVIYKVMHEAAPPPRLWNAALPARYDDVFARALAKDPAARFPTATEFVAALDIKELEYMLSEPVAASPLAAARSGDDSPTILAPPPAAPARPTAGRGARGFVLAALGLLALFAASWLVLRRAPTEPAEAAAPPATLESPAALPAAPTPALTPAPTPEAATPAPSARPRVAAAPKPSPKATPTPEPTATPPPTPAPVVEGDLVELGPGVTPPVRISGDSATYPERARKMKLRGSVLVALIVDENGLPTDLQVVESAGPILDEVVLKAMRTWRF